MSGHGNAECRRNSWFVAVAGGVLVALLLMLVAKYAVVLSVLIGAVLAAVLGAFLVWAFCSEIEAPAAKVSLPQPVPAAGTEPAPVAQATPLAGPADPVAISAELVPAPAATGAQTAKAKAPAKPKARSKPRSAAKPKAAKAPEKVKVEPKRSVTAAALDAALAKSKDAPANGVPELLDAPRGGKADDLKLIKGVGPKLEQLLNTVGVWHFDQIASWKAKNIAFVDEQMEGFKGRITRDEWVKQARVLAKGGETEFSKRAQTGDVY